MQHEHTTMIFDLGGTLVVNPFPEALRLLRQHHLTAICGTVLSRVQAESFLDAWERCDVEISFPFASHFLQEEAFIASAAWDAFGGDGALGPPAYLAWQFEVLSLYRRVALEHVTLQPNLGAVRGALGAARDRGYRLAVGSNDRMWAPRAMLTAAGLADYFDVVVSSEELSRGGGNVEKPSPAFFTELESRMQAVFRNDSTFYLGDDETRDIRSTQSLPLAPVRYFGDTPRAASWVDTPAATEARLSFASFDELRQMIEGGTFDA